MTSLVLSLKMGKIYRLLAAWNFGISIRERERESEKIDVLEITHLQYVIR